MDETSDEIRKDIEQTRHQMGDTVEALAYKADVPTRTKEWVGEKKDALTSKIRGATSKVQDATPDSQQVKRQANVVKHTAERNPLGLALGGAALGFLAGLLAPSTRVEDERIGPVADEVKTTAVEAGKEALERGKQVAQEAGETALDTAKERGREVGEQLSTSVQEKARSVVSSDEESPSRGTSPRGSTA
jgi:gas vesicle protein